MARMCASVKVACSGEPRCPLVPKLTIWVGSLRSGLPSKYSRSSRATSTSISFGACLPARGEIVTCPFDSPAIESLLHIIDYGSAMSATRQTIEQPIVCSIIRQATGIRRTASPSQILTELSLLRLNVTCGRAIGEHHSLVPADPSRGNGRVAFEQTRQHRNLLDPCHQPQNASRTIQHWIGQRHATPAHVHASQPNGSIGDVASRISGYRRGSMSVGPHAEVREVKHRRRSGDLLKRLRILYGSRFQVRQFHRHGIDLLRRQRRMFEQACAQMCQVSIRISGGCDALVNLEDMHVFPRHFFVCQRAQHDPGRMTAADRHDEAPTGCNRSASVRRNGRRRGSCHRFGILKHFQLHSVLQFAAQRSVTWPNASRIIQLWLELPAAPPRSMPDSASHPVVSPRRPGSVPMYPDRIRKPGWPPSASDRQFATPLQRSLDARTAWSLPPWRLPGAVHRPPFRRAWEYGLPASLPFARPDHSLAKEPPYQGRSSPRDSRGNACNSTALHSRELSSEACEIAQ